MQWYIHAMKNYFNFKGRARRKEYWMFLLIYMLGAFVLGLFIGFFKLPQSLVNIYALIHFIPIIMLAIRRNHDTDHRGWWMFLPLYNFYLLVKKGDEGANRFGGPTSGSGAGTATPAKAYVAP